MFALFLTVTVASQLIALEQGSATLLNSSDSGSSWTRVSTPFPSIGGVWSLCNSLSRLFVGGDLGFAFADKPLLDVWTSRADLLTDVVCCRYVASLNLVVLGGSWAGSAKIIYFNDSQVGSPTESNTIKAFSTRVFDMSYSPQQMRWVAACMGALTSLEGSDLQGNWTLRETGMQFVYGVIWEATTVLWVAVGQNVGAPAIWTSSYGRTWQSRVTGLTGGFACWRVAFSVMTSSWVAACNANGNSPISFDGTNWVQIVVPLLSLSDTDDIVYLQQEGRFVVVGDNTVDRFAQIASSTNANGSSWALSSVPTFLGITNEIVALTVMIDAIVPPVILSGVVVVSSTQFFEDVIVSSSAFLNLISGASIVVAKSCTINAGASITLGGVNQTGTFVLITAGNSVTGTFRSIAVNSECGSSASFTPVQTSSSVSVLVTNLNCGQDAASLSTGALVGIAIGAAVGASVVVVILVVVMKRMLENRTGRMKRELISENMLQLKRTLA